MTPQEARAMANDFLERAKTAPSKDQGYLKGRAEDLFAFARREGREIAAANRVRAEKNQEDGRPRSRLLKEAKARIRVLKAELDAAKLYVAENCPEHVEDFALTINAASEDADQ